MIEVMGPDGAVHAFPDGTNPDIIKGAMARAYPRKGSLAGAQASGGVAAGPTNAHGMQAFGPVDQLAAGAREMVNRGREAWDAGGRSQAPATGVPALDTALQAAFWANQQVNPVSQLMRGASAGAAALGVPLGAPLHSNQDMASTPQIDAAVTAQNAAHPLGFDPNHVRTNREVDDAAGNVALMALPPARLQQAGELLGGLADSSAAALARRAPKLRDIIPARPPQAMPAAPALSPPEQTAAASLVRNIQAGGQTPTQFVAALDANPKALPVHVNRGVASVGEVIAQGAGPGAAPLKTAIDAWRMDVPDHVTDAVADAHGIPGQNIETKLAEVKKTRSTEAAAGMRQFGNDVVTLSPETTQQVTDPFFAPALSDIIANNAASRSPTDRSFSAALRAAVERSRAAPGTPLQMRIEDVNLLKRDLRQHADAGYSATADTAAKRSAPRFAEAANGLRDDAASQHQGYRDWLTQFGQSADHEAALNLGYDGLFSHGRATTTGAQQAALDALHTPNSVLQPSYAEGTISKLIAQANDKGDLIAIRQVLKGREGKTQLRMALGDEKANALISSLDTLATHAVTNDKIIGNSATYGRLATAAAEQAAARTPLQNAAAMVDHIPHGPVGALISGGKAIARNIAKEDLSVVGNPAANEALGKALADPAEARRLLEQSGLLHAPSPRLTQTRMFNPPRRIH